MVRRRPYLLVLSALLLLGSSRAFTQSSKLEPTIEDIRKELMQLPYYGVFDFLSFSYEKGTVSLYGYAYHPGLKSDAERAVKRASRVDQVVNKIEDLPPSSLDDDLRWQVYYAIYRDPFLSRYAPGGAMLWGHRHGYSGPFGRFGPSRFPGTEPAGNFPIHIIVKGLRVTLLGVVDNDGDKNLAGMKARGVPGGLGLENELAVEKSK
jgi:hyperosmotically inducible periplasmic protein